MAQASIISGMAALFSPSCGRVCSVLSLLLFLLWGFFRWSSHGQTTPVLYVFGDSLADVGNNNFLILSLLKANFPHNGIDYAGRNPTGRFSNGKNFVDFLAEKLALQSPPPYLSILPIFGADVYLKGVSFAWGGAGILSTTNEYQCLSLDKQIEFFSKVRTALRLKLGDVEMGKHLSRSIFVVVIGSNDLLQYADPTSSERARFTLQQFVNSMILKLGGQLRSIYDLGARKLAFIGTGPVGCCPTERTRSQNGDCNAEPNGGSTMFNAGVTSLLQGIKTAHSDFSYSFFDNNAATAGMLSSPSSFGFTEVKAACCGLGKLNAEVPCLPIATYCSNRQTYFFWDLYHPTETVARMLAEKLVDGAAPFVYPLNVRQLSSLVV